MIYEQKVHCNPGKLGVKTVFVFSCPGREEEEKGRPVSGATGKNFRKFLKLCKSVNSVVFPHEDNLIGNELMYSYPITNAHDKVYFNKKNGRSEAKDSEIKDSKNIKRLMKELKGYTYVFACGQKAQMAMDEIKRIKPNFFSEEPIYICHLSNIRLNLKYSGQVLRDVTELEGNARVQLVVDGISDRLKELNKSNKCVG